MKLRFYLLFLFITASAHEIKHTQSVCPPILKSEQSCNKCTLDQWAKKVWSMKEFPAQISSLPLKSNYEKSILTKKEFLKAIFDCAKVIECQCAPVQQWLNNKSLAKVTNGKIFALEIEKFIFEPYAEKILVAPSSEAVFFGDLHGSAHSLVRDLMKLKQDGFLDSNFKIKNKNNYLVFLGDYIDRGSYGVEVIYTICRLKIANPKNVIIVRGNHEEYYLAEAFQKKYKDLEEKDSAPSFLTELQRKFAVSQHETKMLFRFYDILPVVLYLGFGDTKKVYFHCCHGGLELGYNPYDLLNSSKKYEVIEKFKRKTYFDKLPADLQKNIKENFGDKVYQVEIQNIKFETPILLLPDGGFSYTGFLWADFYSDPEKIIGLRPGKYPSWVFGKKLVEEILKQSSSCDVILGGVIRGHQHNNETGGPFLDMLCCGKGVYNVWDDNKLYSLLSGPASKLDPSGQMCFTYDSFLKLKFGKKSYEYAHYNQDIAVRPMRWNVKKRKINLYGNI